MRLDVGDSQSEGYGILRFFRIPGKLHTLHIAAVMLSAWLQYLLLLLLVLEAQGATAQTVEKSAPKKRGSGWGYTAQNVSDELQATPVRWWYNWGNGIPDRAAEATTAVTITANCISLLYGASVPQPGWDDLKLTSPMLCSGRRH